MSTLDYRIAALMRDARASGGTVKVSVPLADLRALHAEAENLRIAIDKAVDAFHTHGKGVALSVLNDLEKARAASKLYDESEDT